MSVSYLSTVVDEQKLPDMKRRFFVLAQIGWVQGPKGKSLG
jgi:hypothetical protein